MEMSPVSLNTSQGGMHLFQYQTYQEEDKPQDRFETNHTQGNEQLEQLSKEQSVLANRMLAKNSILSQNSPDKATIFYTDEKADGSFDPPEERTALENQRQFLKKYAITVQLPSIYVIDAQINNVFPDYCFQLVKCVLPNKETQIVNTTFLDGRTSTSIFSKLYYKYKRGLILRMLRRDKSQLVQEREVILEGIFNAHMKFSKCGT